jgi:hypothetical protein
MTQPNSPVRSRSSSPASGRQASEQGAQPVPAQASPGVGAGAGAGAGTSRLTRSASQAGLTLDSAPKRLHNAGSAASGSAHTRVPVAALHGLRRSASPEHSAQQAAQMAQPVAEPDFDHLPAITGLADLPSWTGFLEDSGARSSGARSPSIDLNLDCEQDLFVQQGPAAGDTAVPAVTDEVAPAAALDVGTALADYDPLAEPDPDAVLPVDGLKVVPTKPVSAAHQELIENLPAELSQKYRSCVSRFLAHLEGQRTSWAEVSRPDALCWRISFSIKLSSPYQRLMQVTM